MAITVTLSGSTGTAALAVKVLTGAAASQPGATASSTTATAKAITPSGTGSYVYGAMQVFHGLTSGGMSLYTPNAATSVFSDATNSAAREAVSFRSASTTTSGTPVTLGFTAKGDESTFALALCEILASGTLAEDASSPAALPASGVGNLTPVGSLTTASFTPPAGALLVAMGSVGSGTPAVSDSSGLTWTRQLLVSGGSGVQAGIWTATVTTPVSGAATLAGAGSLTAAGTVLVPGAATLAGAGSLTATSAVIPGRSKGDSTGTSVGQFSGSSSAVGKPFGSTPAVTG
jgi:hypothetical protein